MKRIIGFLTLALSVHASTASWYGKELAGRPMANGKPFDPTAWTCACWDYPLGTRLVVTSGSYSIIVTVTDRGPAKRLVARGRVIDLSQAAFAQLADPKQGIIEVTVSKLP